MKVVFYFMSQKSGLVDSDWKNQKCGKQYEKHYSESYFKMLKALLDNKVITDLTVFFESAQNPGIANFVPGAKNYVVPHIEMTDEFIDNDTVIFVRGGFKHWHDWLLKYKETNWLLCYAANTGRERWKLWDVIFDDLEMKNTIDKYERYYFPFIKPTNEDIFYPTEKEPFYDICIGASHIHDKKGQWMAVEVIERFQEIYGYYPSMIMPGALRGSTKTNEMLSKRINQEIIYPGMLSKEELAEIFNNSKIYIGIGPGGQNDRGILEAWACGMKVIYSAKHRHTPLLQEDLNSTFYWSEEMTIDQKAHKLKFILDSYPAKKEDIFNQKQKRNFKFKKRMGFYEVIFYDLLLLFNCLNLKEKQKLEIKEKLVNLFTKLKEVFWK